VGPLEERGRLSVRKGGECDVKSRYPQGCSPGLCRWRTNGLASMGKYWTYWSHIGVMSPVSLVACYQQRVTLSPLLQWLPWGEKLDTDPRIGQPSCCGLGQEPFFSGIVALSITIDDFMKCCYMWTAWDTYGRGPYVDQAWKVCDVLVRFAPAGCTSIQITTTLGYE
jgi:hypothetical protein